MASDSLNVGLGFVNSDADKGWVFGSPSGSLDAAIGRYFLFDYESRYAPLEELEADYLREDWYENGPEIVTGEADDLTERPDWGNKVTFSARGSVHKWPSDQVRQIAEEGSQIEAMELLGGHVFLFRAAGASRIRMDADLGRYTHDEQYDRLAVPGIGAPASLQRVRVPFGGVDVEALIYVDVMATVRLLTADGQARDVGQGIHAALADLSATDLANLVGFHTGKWGGYWLGMPSEAQRTHISFVDRWPNGIRFRASPD